MKKLVVVATVVGLGLTGVAGSAQAKVAPAVAKIKWGKCPADPDLTKAQCGQLSVPLDYRHPKGKHISIAVSRLVHTDKKHYQGVLLANPGGPGGSGLYISGGMARWFTGAGHPEIPAQYDVIGFDPRGVGASKPALSCEPTYSDPIRPDYVPHSKKAEQAWINRSKGYAKACGKKFGWLLPHLRTTDAAQDMDSIRAALGAKKLNYYGFSYGTYLGSVYGSMYPTHVRRMVLDGNVDNREVWYQANLSQDKAWERNMGLYFDWAAKYDKLYHFGDKGKKAEALYYKVRAAALKKPIGGKIGGDELDDIFLNVGYNTGYYIELSEALSAWVTKHDAKPLLSELGEGGDDNEFAMYNAVQNVDAAWPRDWSKWHKDATKLYKQGYKFNTWSNVWFNAPAAFWPVKGGPKARIHAPKMPKALLVQSTLDAATPYPGGVEMHKLLPSRLLAELGGKTHANTLNGNKCLDDKVSSYLATGWLPKNKPGTGPDITCKADPALNDPNPNAALARSHPTGKDRRIGVRP